MSIHLASEAEQNQNLQSYVGPDFEVDDAIDSALMNSVSLGYKFVGVVVGQLTDVANVGFG
jgi:hypothetical protein